MRCLLLCCLYLGYSWIRYFCRRLLRCCCCCCLQTKPVYLLDRESNGLTERIAEALKSFFFWSFDFVPVKSLEACTEDYAIALLVRHQTRILNDIEVGIEGIPEGSYSRIAILFIHVVNKKAKIPDVPSNRKFWIDKKQPIILDFGFEDFKCTGRIIACIHKKHPENKPEDNIDSKAAFVNFVNASNTESTPLRRAGYQ